MIRVCRALLLPAAASLIVACAAPQPVETPPEDPERAPAPAAGAVAPLTAPATSQAPPQPAAQATPTPTPGTPGAAPQLAEPPSPAVAPVQPAPAAATIAPTPQAPPVNEDEQQAIAVLADLQRYAGTSGDELRREIAAMLQAVARNRNDANRIRLAMLLTISGSGSQDDTRALALLDAVIGRTPASTPLKQLAVVLYGQVSERVRGIRDEQRRTAAAQEKLDALRAVERSLLMERSRNAGGSGGSGGSAGGTGGR